MTRMHSPVCRKCISFGRGSVRRLARARSVIAVTIGLFFSLVLPSRAQEKKPGEYDVKAAYLYNFGRFVEWPPAAAPASSDSFPVCILGRDPFGPILDETLANEVTNGRALLAKRISKLQEVTDCRILFISSSEASRLKEILEAVHKTRFSP